MQYVGTDAATDPSIRPIVVIANGASVPAGTPPGAVIIELAS